MEMILPQVLNSHLVRYPAMQVQDIYKLLYQAALGSGHAVRDQASARDRLERELAEMGAGPEHPPVEPISPDGRIVRLHLRPWLAAGKDPQVLLSAFLRTAREWQGSLETLRLYGSTAARWMEAQAGLVRKLELEDFFTEMERQGFPAVHHSPRYASLYRPAYRVVAVAYLEEP